VGAASGATDLVLVRHGETNFNVDGRISSTPDDRGCFLSEIGQQQAADLARNLADDDLELCVTSELWRARQTADVVLDGRPTPRFELAELNDVAAGTFDQGSSNEYVEWIATSGGMGRFAPPGGESLRDAVGRYLRAFEWLLRLRRRNLLVITHALPVGLVLHAVHATERPRDELLVALFAQKAGAYGPSETVRHAWPYRLTRDDLRRAIDYWTRG
jgi:probable phosphoglycerate mutase